MTDPLNPDVVLLGYAVGQLHSLLADGAGRREGPNVGIKGEHLTLVVLTFDRPAMIERLVSSVERHMPHFEGEILVVDNGSRQSAFDAVATYLSKVKLRVRHERLGSNLGVAAGRNAAAHLVRSDWMLMMDDDIYLIGNPLPMVQEDLARLGCKFANARILNSDRRTSFAHGGHLFVGRSGTRLVIGHGSAHAEREVDLHEPIKPELGTFLFGTAAFIERQAFLACGGFDERLFVGFEDTDLSIRLFRSGAKIGAVGPFFFVHDHPKPDSTAESNYERIRYSRKMIKDAAIYLEGKHSFGFWTESLDRWLAEKGSKAPPSHWKNGTAPAQVTSRPRIAIVSDVEFWALSNIARQVQRTLIERFDVTVLPYEIVNDDFRLFVALSGHDLVHVLWRPILLNALRGNAQAKSTALGWNFRSLVTETIGTAALTFGIYDHLFLDGDEWQAHMPLFQIADGYSVSSQRLFDIYSSRTSIPPPDAVLSDGVDLRRFRGHRRQYMPTRPTMIGWAGNSAWNGLERDAKGVHTILRPALELLRKRGLDVREHFADRHVELRSLAEMPSYYDSIDIYVCASMIEGTPNPVLEAMASGLPIVSTEVGVVTEAFGPIQSQLIVADRSPEAMADAIERLIVDPDLYATISVENLQSISMWDWRIRAAAFGPFFEGALAKRAARAAHTGLDDFLRSLGY